MVTTGIFASLSKRQTRKSVIHRFGRNIAFMKKIAAHQDEINFFTNGVFFKTSIHASKKSRGRFVELIARAAEMHVGNVEEFHRDILPQRTQRIRRELSTDEHG